MNKYILLIAGLDPTANAGLLKDSEICQNLQQNFYAFPTALTAQSDRTYFGTIHLSKNTFKDFWKNINQDSIHTVKIGMLADCSTVDFIVYALKKLKNINSKLKIVWDPVFQSSSGGQLLSKVGIKVAKHKLLPLITIITPNAVEVCELLEIPYSQNLDPQTLCIQFFNTFKIPIYLKGGHLKNKSIDTYYNGKTIRTLKGKTKNKKIRGTGCIHSTVLSCYLNLGDSLEDACQKSKTYMNTLFDN